jgi:HEPN domain-containing protein
MADSAAHARGWLLKGESDLSAAQRTILDGDGPYDTACFHVQQAVEKYLKGFLAWRDQPIPHTHNLEELARFCQDVSPELNFGTLDVTELTPFAVEMPYDFEFWPSRETADEAFALAVQVRESIRAVIPSQAKP